MEFIISSQKLQQYRAWRFHTQDSTRLKYFQQAVEFVNERGYIFFWPNKGVILPSLWSAVAGDRPVPDEHDDPGHITWDWKDKSLGQRIWYYGRVIANRNAMISLDSLPYFYALSPNYGNPAEDYLEQYAAGKLTAESRSVYEILLDNGPLDTLELRRKVHLASNENESRFTRAISTLQMEFKLLPVGISPVGAWKYAFIYDLSHRHFPNLVNDAHLITENEAIIFLVEKYLQSVGVATLAQIGKIIRRTPGHLQSILDKLVENGTILHPCEVENQPGDHYCIPAILYN